MDGWVGRGGELEGWRGGGVGGWMESWRMAGWVGRGGGLADGWMGREHVRMG